ncbi:MAG: lactate racemization operon protein LarA [Firmicutes bacterium HGW-Firmicutes-12]|jgi:nickel-dependent lactate racemase|nr:MAG: lactate racemization operon protein LarA [Firmicutes bacterium HGW-Firmicutes-12]
MVTISIPYGHGNLSLDLPETKLAGVLVSKAHDYKAEGTETEIVQKALDQPINSLPLSELAKGKKKVVIISSDHTRPVPSHVTMPLLLNEIRKGNPEAEITILIATGYHRLTTKDELRNKYGKKIFETENIIVHNAFEDEDMVDLGKLPSGGDLKINKLALSADLLIAEGFIEPHFFAGFSGGRKSILPGIASKDTVMANHCAEFIAHEKARTGIIEGNPIHTDMIYAAQKAGLAFILNVVIDSEKKVIEAFAGHINDAHITGCEFVRELAGVQAIPADIVITSNGGYPLDQNLYQTGKGMSAAEATCKPGGVIIIAAQCADGHGGEGYYNTYAQADSVEDIYNQIIRRSAEETIPDQWQSQILARILLKYEVIMVTEAPQEMVENMFKKWAPNLEKALEMAEEILKNDNSKITVIPDGVSVIVQ